MKQVRPILSAYRRKKKEGVRSGSKTLKRRKVWWERNGQAVMCPWK